MIVNVNRIITFFLHFIFSLAVTSKQEPTKKKKKKTLNNKLVKLTKQAEKRQINYKSKQIKESHSK